MFHVSKKVIATMPKCYAICMLESGGETSFLVATEKEGACNRFDTDGNLLETIWTEPGGVMTMVQVPGGNGAFLSTHEFFSPNDSAKAKLVLAEPVGTDGRPVKNLQEEHTWKIRTICPLPFVHRFDILESAGKHYIIACTLKSGHEYKEDWTHPGKVQVRELPADFAEFDADAGKPMEFSVLLDGQTKNHGYGRFVNASGQLQSLIATDNGLFRITPPTGENPEWQVEKLLDKSCSDVRAYDIDEDGRTEFLLYAPFHGAELTVWRETETGLTEIYRNEEELPFLHALWGGELAGLPAFLVGHRQGNRDLLALTWDEDNQQIKQEKLDQNIGPTNVQVFRRNGQDYIISANREIDEVALYTIS